MPRGRRRLGRKSLRAAIQTAIRHLYRHEEQIFVYRNIALPARAHQRSQQRSLRRIGDVINIHAVKVSLEKVVALKGQVRVGERELRDHNLQSLRHLQRNTAMPSWLSVFPTLGSAGSAAPS